MLDLQSFTGGSWHATSKEARDIACAITGQPFARAGSQLDADAARDHAVGIGGPALQALTFHARAAMLKKLAQYLNERRETLYRLSHHTGATQRDNMVDIDGGIGTLFVYASKGKRELPDTRVMLDGKAEMLSRDGAFAGQHIFVPRPGFALHINAFNFPVWGMLEKLAPALLAGTPCIVKPATASAYLTEACFRMIIDSGILPDGAVQLVLGDVSDLIERMTAQDVLAFTGSAATARLLRGNTAFLDRGAHFMAEQDSLNASILGPDASVESAEFALFVKEALREITTKAGQKCTATRRLIVPGDMIDPVRDALLAGLAKITVGDPRLEAVRMGALVSGKQRRDVIAAAEVIASEAERLTGDPDDFEITGDEAQGGAFVPPMLFLCADPDNAKRVHDTEAFGPVSTLMPYRDAAHAARLANRGGGSLVASVFTGDTGTAEALTLAMAPWHGRLYFNNGRTGKGATGHGAPMPHLTHGGPGRAGGGEELGGIRGVTHYMQRTAIQGDPATLTAIGKSWQPSTAPKSGETHPFRKNFGALQVGESLTTEEREITLEDIEHFADFTGDTFYAHMDETAAQANPFFPGRVAHGYLLLSFAAGLFVDPDPGPVLANTGLDTLRFMKPVVPGDRIRVTLTVMAKTPRRPEYGEVRWHVVLTNQEAETVATYELLTMNATE